MAILHERHVLARDRGSAVIAAAASFGTACASGRRKVRRGAAHRELHGATAGPKLVEAAAGPAVRTTPVAGDKVLPQKLLFEAAHKAGEAGEPALAIQLYARLLARYPETAFAAQARAAVESEKRKLAKA